MEVEVLYINEHLLATATYIGPSVVISTINNNARYSIPEYYICTFRSLEFLVEGGLNESAL